ncbi:Acyl-CoA synthetases (AMP-forming)/AMP-acid ligases II [Balamuthia mandrillaris]
MIKNCCCRFCLEMRRETVVLTQPVASRLMRVVATPVGMVSRPLPLLTSWSRLGSGVRTTYTMRDILAHPHRLHPKNTCLAFEDQRYTFERFDRRTTAVACAMKHVFGVRRCDHVAVLSPNDPRYVEMYYANAKLGAVTCPAVHLFSRTELTNVINNTLARVLVVHETMIPTLMDIKPSLRHVQHMVSLSSKVGTARKSHLSTSPSSSYAFHDYDELVNKFDEGKVKELEEEEISETDIATMFITSGTTGFPKAAAYSHRAVVALVSRNLFRFTPQSVICLTNLCAWIGSVDLIASIFAAGGKAVLLGSNDFEGYIEAMLQHGATHALFMPGVMHSFARLDPHTKQRIAEKLQVMVYVGGTIPVRVLQQVIKSLPNTAIIQTYGLTECVGVTALTEDDHPQNPSVQQLKRLESCGRLLFEAKLKIVGKDGSECGPEEEGEIVVKTPNMMSGYFNQPHETMAVLKNGWFHTGDVGYVDHEGYLFLLSRIKDVINPPSGLSLLFSSLFCPRYGKDRTRR